jgi:CheY-like chemotaxis protein
MGGPVRVLLVDEDSEVLDVTRTFLEREGSEIEVVTATSGRAALDRVESSSFDVVVSDYRMPEMDGLALAEAIHERAPGLPYVLYTARDSAAFESELGATVAGHVHKRTGSDQYVELADLVRDVATGDE